MKDRIVIAAALTVSCAALFVLYDILIRSLMISDLVSRGSEYDDDTRVVHEEDTGDAYEI